MEQPPHNRRRDFVAVALLAALALAFWGNCVFAGKVPVAAIYQKQMLPWSAVAEASSETRQWDSLLWDSMAQFYPWRLLLHRAAQSNELPLWNPYQFCGYPFVGNGQSAMFYPPNWLYFVVHPKVGLGLSAALHFFLGGVFVFGLARAWKLSILSSLFAALAFSYGGFMVTWIELPTLPNSLIWLPLAWWGIEVICRSEGPATSRPAVRGTLMLALALGMTLLAGHFQIAAYVWIFAFLYALIRLVTKAVGAAETACGLTCAAGPTAGGARRTADASVRIRGTHRLAAVALAFALGLMLAMAQILPTLELGKYSSRGTGGPSAVGFEFHRQRALQPIELATLLMPDFLGSPVTNDYPGISYSEHCGFVGAITLLLGIAGLVLKPRRKMAWLFGGIAVFALWGAMAGPPAMLLYWCVPKLGQAGGFPRLLSVWTLAAALWGAAGLQAIIESLRGGAVTVGRGLVPRRPFAVSLVALALLLVQLLPWAYRFNPRAQAADVYPETEAIRQLRSVVGSHWYLAVTPKAAWTLLKTPTGAVLPPNAATVYGLRSADGYDSLFPANYRKFAAMVEEGDPSPPSNGNMLLLANLVVWPKNAVLTSAEATLATLAPEHGWRGGWSGVTLTPEYGWRRGWSGEGCVLWRNPLFENHGPRGSIRLQKMMPWGRLRIVGFRLPGAERETLNSYTATFAPPGQTAELFLWDTRYPGWQAYADAVRAPLERSDVSRRVSLKGTETRVQMIYFPASVACGLFVSLIALAAMMGLAVFMRGGGLRG